MAKLLLAAMAKPATASLNTSSTKADMSQMGGLYKL